MPTPFPVLDKPYSEAFSIFPPHATSPKLPISPWRRWPYGVKLALGHALLESLRDLKGIYLVCPDKMKLAEKWCEAESSWEAPVTSLVTRILCLLPHSMSWGSSCSRWDPGPAPALDGNPCHQCLPLRNSWNIISAFLTKEMAEEAQVCLFLEMCISKDLSPVQGFMEFKNFDIPHFPYL